MYVVAGGGGANLASNGDTTEWKDGDIFHSVYHYLNLTVRNNKIEVETLEWNEITQETSIIDTFELSLELEDPSETITTTATSSKTTNLQYFVLIPLFCLIISRNRKNVG